MIGKHGEKQFEALKSFKKMPSVKNRISERSLNPEILIEVKTSRNNSKKLINEKQSTKDAKARPVLQNFKQYEHLEMLLRIV